MQKVEPTRPENQGNRQTIFSIKHFKAIVISRRFRFDVGE
jgi:hypothetical protein